MRSSLQGLDLSPRTNSNFDTNTKADAIPGLHLTNQITQARISSKIISGNTSTGLPFHCLVHHEGVTNPTSIMSFINTHVLPLIATCAAQLSTLQPDDYDAPYIRKLMLDIHQARLDNNIPEEDMRFIMALAINYTKYNAATKTSSLHCAGFGVGTAMLVLQKNNGDIETLADYIEIHKRDTNINVANDFNISTDTFSNLIARNTVFSTEVRAGETLFAFAQPGPMRCERSAIEHIENKNELIVRRARAHAGRFTEHQKNNQVLYGKCELKIPTTLEQAEAATLIYQQEKTRFKKFMEDISILPDIKKILRQILAKTEAAESQTTDVSTLTRTLTSAYNLVLKPTPENFSSVREQANLLDHSSHYIHKALAIGLTVLGLVMVGIGITSSILGIGLVPGLIIGVSGSLLLSAGIYCMASSFSHDTHIGHIGFFSHSKFGKFGVSRELHTLADEAAHLQLAR